jgi:peptidoglycan glycosyltransferase
VNSQAHLQKLNRILLISFLAVTLSLIFWSVIRAQTILSREDNPRLVEAELRIQRGAILDRQGVILAQTTGEENNLQRQYPIANIGPAVGYYSFKHGTAGVEEGFDAVLRGQSDDLWPLFVQQALHSPQTGRDIQLTLDATWQQTADSLLGSRHGALILLNVQNGHILAMVSHPTYDPNQLDDLFDTLSEDETAPLLNRAIQGQYQPGRILQPFILASAQEQNLLSPSAIAANPDRPVPVDGQTTRCTSTPPEPATWVDVLVHRCPGPMQDLADQLGIGGLDQIFANFGLTATPYLPLNTETTAPEPLTDPLTAGIGQDNMTVTPLQVALAWAAFGADGRIPVPQLVTAVQDEEGVWQTVPQPETEALTPVSEQTVQTMRRELVQVDNIEYSVLVLSGPEGSTNGWYLGLSPADAPKYALVVIVEGSDDANDVEQIGQEMLRTIE